LLVQAFGQERDPEHVSVTRGFAFMSQDRSPNPKMILVGVLIMDCVFWAALIGLFSSQWMH